jgi:hypothetical protein
LIPGDAFSVILGKGKGSICGWLLVGEPSLRRLFFQMKQHEMREILKRKSAARMIPIRAEDGRCFPAARCREVVEAGEGVDGADGDFDGLTDIMLVWP